MVSKPYRLLRYHCHYSMADLHPYRYAQPSRYCRSAQSCTLLHHDTTSLHCLGPNCRHDKQVGCLDHLMVVSDDCFRLYQPDVLHLDCDLPLHLDDCGDVRYCLRYQNLRAEGCGDAEVCGTTVCVGGDGDDDGDDNMSSYNPNSKDYSNHNANYSYNRTVYSNSMDYSSRNTSYTKVLQLHPTSQTSKLHT